MLETLYINLHENTKDYVSVGVYNMQGRCLDYVEIAKPFNVKDYTKQWKKDLATWYKNQHEEFNIVCVNYVEN